MVNVLVIDDEPLIRWALQEALGEEGFSVTVAGDGNAALQSLGSGADAPDVVLLDYLLPDSDGLSLFKTIRRMVPAGQVILMTAYGAPEVTRDAMDLGAYQVVIKPFEVRDIAALIRHAHDAPRPGEKPRAAGGPANAAITAVFPGR
jgi:DNA-binding NtrC family response regulator